MGHNGFGEIVGETTDAAGAPSPAYDVTYARDPLGRVSQKTETLGGQTHTLEYQYDEEGRLTGVIQDATTTLESYTYDDNGNRLTALGVTSITYDAQDRLIEYGDSDYAYRDSGQLLTKTNAGATTTYDYDAARKPVVGDPSDRNRGRLRNRRDESPCGSSSRWSSHTEVDLQGSAEPDRRGFDDQGNLVSLFIYGTRSHVPDGMVKDGVRYLFVTDQVGSVRLVVNAETGAVAQQIDYDAWGNVMFDSTPGFQPFAFAGGLYDGQTKLVRFGARDYAPELGRWTAKDPIRFEGDSWNLYVYVSNDPINAWDPAGNKEVGGCYRQCVDQVSKPFNECFITEAGVVTSVGGGAATLCSSNVPACAVAASALGVASAVIAGSFGVSVGACYVACQTRANNFSERARELRPGR